MFWINKLLMNSQHGLPIINCVLILESFSLCIFGSHKSLAVAGSMDLMKFRSAQSFWMPGSKAGI